MSRRRRIATLLAASGWGATARTRSRSGRGRARGSGSRRNCRVSHSRALSCAAVHPDASKHASSDQSRVLGDVEAMSSLAVRGSLESATCRTHPWLTRWRHAPRPRSDRASVLRTGQRSGTLVLLTRFGKSKCATRSRSRVANVQRPERCDRRGRSFAASGRARSLGCIHVPPCGMDD